MTDKTYSLSANQKHVLVKALKKKGYTEGSIYFNHPRSAGVTGWYLVIGDKREYLGYDIESAGSGINRLKDLKNAGTAPKESYGF